MSEPDRPVYDADGAPRYASALLQVSGRVRDDQVDWDAFHARLNARAELSLARLRYPHVAAHASVPPRSTLPLEQPIAHAWWEYPARWSRLVLTGSVAAGIALIMVVRASPKEVPDTLVATVAATSDQNDGRRAAFESAAIGHGSTWSIDSALLPSATYLLLPLGKGGGSQ